MSLTPRRRAALVAPLVVLGAVLNGCSVSEQQVRPGVAASVDGSDVSSSDVDRLVDGTCDYLDSEDDTPAYPRVTVRRLFFETLVRREAAERLLDELGATLPDDYSAALGEVASSYPSLDDDAAEVMRDGDRELIYVAYAAEAIGNAVLREETGSEPTDTATIRDRGNEAIAEWLADHDVELNPTYGFELQDGAFVAGDGLSVGASSQALTTRKARDIDLAGATAEEQPAVEAAVAEAVSVLPRDQVCGTPAAG